MPTATDFVLEDPSEEDLDDEDIIAQAAEKILAREARRSQWAKNGNAFSRIGETQAELPPGCYEPMSTQQGFFFVPVGIRTDRLLKFPDSSTTEVIDEITKFWACQEAFEKYGFPFKRGLLMYGPPGSGKSSTLRFVLNDLVNQGGIAIIFDNPSNFTVAYRTIRDVQPEVPIVAVMEDLDAIFERLKNSESAILNILDGTEWMHKVVFLATTNYPEKLGPRVINRPSRFDRRFLIPHPGPEGRRVYLEFLAKGDTSIDIEKYIKDSQDMSLAHVKELFVSTIILGNDYAETVATLERMKERVTSLDGDRVFEDLAGRGYA